MDERLARQLVRQLRLLNFYLFTIGGVVIIGLIVVGVLMFKVLSTVRMVTNDVTNLPQSAAQKLSPQQACDSDSTFGSTLRNKTSLCNK